MNKCKYCGKEINGMFRCMDCDQIWQEGFREGEKSICSKLSEVFGHLQNFIRRGNE